MHNLHRICTWITYAAILSAILVGFERATANYAGFVKDNILYISACGEDVEIVDLTIALKNKTAAFYEP